MNQFPWIQKVEVPPGEWLQWDYLWELAGAKKVEAAEPEFDDPPPAPGPLTNQVLIFEHGLSAIHYHHTFLEDVVRIDDPRLDDPALRREPAEYHKVLSECFNQAGAAGKPATIMNFSPQAARLWEGLFAHIRKEVGDKVRWFVFSFFHNEEETAELGADALKEKHKIVSQMNYYPWIERVEVPAGQCVDWKFIAKLMDVPLVDSGGNIIADDEDA
jgi:hypothetical protein